MNSAKRKRLSGRVAGEQAQAHASVSMGPVLSAIPGSKPALLFCCVLLAVLVAIVYWPVAHFPFVNYDDSDYVSGNARVSAGLTWNGIVWAMTSGYAANWHPLTWLSHMLDVELFGMNPGPQHVMNVFLHMVNTLLVFLVFNRITGQLGRSAFVAALFGVHPTHVESVAWIAERKDVLSTLFLMLTIWSYTGYVRRPEFRRYALVFLSMAFGLMAKPMLVTLPFVLLLLDFWPLNRFRVGFAAAAPRLLREKVPLFALAAVSSLITFIVQRQGKTVIGLASIALDRRLANAFISYITYIWKMVWPRRLAALYPYPPTISGWWIGAALLLLAVSVTAVLVARRYPYFTFGWFWYVGTLVPVIGVVQVGVQSMADRYTYVPFIGLFIIVVWAASDILNRWRLHRLIAPTAGILVIGLCGIPARAQLQYWRSSELLWKRAADVTPDNMAAQNEILTQRGIDHARQGKLDEAIQEFAEATRMNSDLARMVRSRSNLGSALFQKGRVDEAIAQYSEAIRLDPDYASAHSNMANALASQGKTAEAIHEFSETLRINPDDQGARVGLEHLRAGK